MTAAWFEDPNGLATDDAATSAWEPAATRMLSRTAARAESEPASAALEPAAAAPTMASAAVVARVAQPEQGGPTLSRTSAPAAIARSPGPGAGEDGYEDFIDRLRRDLLREREQIGDLLGETPW